MSVQYPVLVLVTGAWHVPAHYEPFLDALGHSGFETHCPLLPTCNGSRPPNASLQDDVAAVNHLLRSLVDKDQDVLVVMHSYGGAVGTNAITKGLSAVPRSSDNLPGGVVRLIYMCAFFLQPGETVKSATHVDVDPVVVAEDGTSTIKDPHQMFYHDLDSSRAQKCIELLVPHSVKAFVGEVTETPWKDIPTAYFYCTQDKVLWYDWQRDQVRAAKEQGADVREESFDSSHSPFLSMPKPVIEAILRAWNVSTEAIWGKSGGGTISSGVGV